MVKEQDLPWEPGYSAASASGVCRVIALRVVVPPLPQTSFFGKRGVLNLKKLEKRRSWESLEEVLGESLERVLRE
jgi:hypothetical protein